MEYAPKNFCQGSKMRSLTELGVMLLVGVTSRIALQSLTNVTRDRRTVYECTSQRSLHPSSRAYTYRYLAGRGKS